MNIGFFFNGKLYPPKAGGNVHAYQIVNQLTKRGHTVSTIFYDTADPMLKVYQRRDLLKFVYDLDVLYIRLHGKFDKERMTNLKWLRFGSLPVVWEINAPLEEGVLLGQSKADLSKLVQKRKKLSNMVDAAMCVSKEMQEYAARDLGIKNNHLVTNGSDVSLFSPVKRSPDVYKEYKDYFKIVWAGTAHFQWHGVDIIFKIAEEIYKLDKKIIFILLGNSRDIQLPSTGAPNVVVEGSKDYLDLPPFLAGADMGLCLYEDEEMGIKFYRSPLKLFDYMASGLPVVATKVGQIKDVIVDQKNGYLVERNQLDEIIKHILFLRNNPEQAKAVGAEARKSIISGYTWERVGEKTEAVFKTLVKK